MLFVYNTWFPGPEIVESKIGLIWISTNSGPNHTEEDLRSDAHE